MIMRSSGIPIYRDIGVRRVQDLPRKPWKRMGGSGSFIQLLGTEGLWGCFVVEVPGAGTELKSICMRSNSSSSRAAAPRKSGLRGTARSLHLNGKKALCSPFQ